MVFGAAALPPHAASTTLATMSRAIAIFNFLDIFLLLQNYSLGLNYYRRLAELTFQLTKLSSVSITSFLIIFLYFHFTQRAGENPLPVARVFLGSENGNCSSSNTILSLSNLLFNTT
jgi:hypothetical protein